MTEHISILLVEDTRAIATEVYDFLEEQGLTVDYAEKGKDGLNLAMAYDYDVIVLDIMLPDMSGIDVCEQLKQRCNPVPPILMLTARDSIEDKTIGFEAGADDYLTKPFALQELFMRCKALVRRKHLRHANEIVIGELVVNARQNQISRNGVELKLSQTDFALLMLMVEAYPNAISRQQVIKKIWGDDFPDSDVLRSHIYTLRQALDKPFAHPMLKTIHGIGFKLVP